MIASQRSVRSITYVNLSQRKDGVAKIDGRSALCTKYIVRHQELGDSMQQQIAAPRQCTSYVVKSGQLGPVSIVIVAGA